LIAKQPLTSLISAIGRGVNFLVEGSNASEATASKRYEARRAFMSSIADIGVVDVYHGLSSFQNGCLILKFTICETEQRFAKGRAVGDF
jgi:hypothetical protein